MHVSEMLVVGDFSSHADVNMDEGYFFAEFASSRRRRRRTR